MYTAAEIALSVVIVLQVSFLFSWMVGTAIAVGSGEDRPEWD
jgi:hypothetical protein